MRIFGHFFAIQETVGGATKTEYDVKYRNWRINYVLKKCSLNMFHSIEYYSRNPKVMFDFVKVQYLDHNLLLFINRHSTINLLQQINFLKLQ